MLLEHLGEPLTAVYSIPGGQARLYERGVTVNGPGGVVVVSFAFPMIGRPSIVTTDGAPGIRPRPLGTQGEASTMLGKGGMPSPFESDARPFEPDAISFRLGNWQLEQLTPLIQQALAGRLSLVATGQPAIRVPLTIGSATVITPELTVYAVAVTSATLQERQLYDVAVLADNGQWRVVAPHAVYYRKAWTDFGLAHITDLHLARRIDSFRGKLEQLGRHEAAQKMYNWNDRFRGFIRYANYLHSIGVLDIILATGDIFDYLYDHDAHENGDGNALFFDHNADENAGGNALFARNLILGKVPGPHFPDVEELRVPIFMVPGNHDYRKHPYLLHFKLDLGWFKNWFSDTFHEKDDRRVQNSYGYHLHWRDALALTRGDNSDEEPELTIGEAARMVKVDEELRPYTRYLADRRSYMIRLGAHRVVMLDSKWDVGILDDEGDLERSLNEQLTEDEQVFRTGMPNSAGVFDEDLALTQSALSETREDALFILGIHAPLLNIKGGEYPYFLRETQRGSLPQQVVGFLDRLDEKGDKDDQKTIARHPSWFPPEGDQRPVSYIKRGGRADYLRFDVSRGRAEDLIRLLTGKGAPRPADLVLSGHTHLHNEFRVGRADGELAFYTDFYTQNPAQYYPARFLKTGHYEDEDDTDMTYVDVVAGAPADGTPSRMPYTTMHNNVIQVPPYPRPLATATDPRAWWTEHRPLLLQTGGLGRLENSQVSFSGFRLLLVKSNVIDKIHHVSTERLHASDYRLPWENVIQPEAGRSHLLSQRSREYALPEATGNPFGFVYPPIGSQNLIYRAGDGRLFELWRDSTGVTGTGHLQSGPRAPRAVGDPFVYLDPTTQQVFVLYCGDDGHVHSLYYSTGDVGHDKLSASARAPKAAGIPVGYFNTATNFHHVIYRAVDRHLRCLFWTGQGAVSHEDLTDLAGVAPASGDPSVYFDPVQQNNFVVYRGVDNHIHSLYWALGPVGHDNLSGFVQTPRAVGNPVAYARDNIHQVTYRAENNHLYEIHWTGINAAGAWDLTASAGAPPAASDPAAYYSPRTNTKHVYYRSAEGYLHEIWWIAGSADTHHVDLTALARAPLAAGNPTAFEGSTYRHLAYRGMDNQVYELRWLHHVQQFIAITPLVATPIIDLFNPI